MPEIFSFLSLLGSASLYRCTPTDLSQSAPSLVSPSGLCCGNLVPANPVATTHGILPARAFQPCLHHSAGDLRRLGNVTAWEKICCPDLSVRLSGIIRGSSDPDVTPLTVQASGNVRL